MDAYENENDIGNSDKFHTGELCIVSGCFEPAGTSWGEYWCFACNVRRMKSVHSSMQKLIDELAAQKI